jgi:hypothetical protein
MASTAWDLGKGNHPRLPGGRLPGPGRAEDKLPERYRERMTVDLAPEKAKAPDLAATFSQSFGKSLGLYADNYLV